MPMWFKHGYTDSSGLHIERGWNELRNRKPSTIGVYVAIAVMLSVGMVGCATQATNQTKTRADGLESVTIHRSYLKPGKVSTQPDSQNSDPANTPLSSGSLVEQAKAKKLDPIFLGSDMKSSSPPLNDMFSTEMEYSVSSEKMPVKDFIHYVFGDLLGVNYIVDESIQSDSDSETGFLTMNIAKPINARELFDLTNDLFIKRGISIKYGNEAFFLYRPSELGFEPQVAIGIGRTPSSVPKTSQKILQVIPLRFGLRGSLERTLRDLVPAKITPDFEQSTMFVEGTRQQILRALELIEMLDIPAMRGKYIGLSELEYNSPDDIAIEVKTLLSNEGIDASIKAPNQKNVVMVPLRRLGAIVVFASSEFLLERVNYWIRLADTPSSVNERQYFVYNPLFARAKDLGENIARLLGFSLESPSKNLGPVNSTGNAPSDSRVSSGSETVKLVVDERSNTIIFYTSAEEYRNIKALLQKLDTSPRQVMLEVVIAEVSLKDEFKYGVEWALRNGEVTLTTEGAWGVNTIGGLGLIIDGNDGPITSNFFANNSLVHVLSNPSIMVLDGVSATINVGSDISVVGETSQDPNGERLTISTAYRSTGLDVTVTPTINAHGVVTMEINQNISNSLPGSGAGGNPDIFNRTISTEVVSKSGQTILLGGLISSSKTAGGGGTPFLKDIPLLGGLFKANSTSQDRTELVMMVTPKVLEDISEWDLVKADFKEGLRYLDIE